MGFLKSFYWGVYRWLLGLGMGDGMFLGGLGLFWVGSLGFILVVKNAGNQGVLWGWFCLGVVCG